MNELPHQLLDVLNLWRTLLKTIEWGGNSVRYPALRIGITRGERRHVGGSVHARSMPCFAALGAAAGPESACVAAEALGGGAGVLAGPELVLHPANATGSAKHAAKTRLFTGAHIACPYPA